MLWQSSSVESRKVEEVSRKGKILDQDKFLLNWMTVFPLYYLTYEHQHCFRGWCSNVNGLTWPCANPGTWMVLHTLLSSPWVTYSHMVCSFSVGHSFKALALGQEPVRLHNVRLLLPHITSHSTTRLSSGYNKMAKNKTHCAANLSQLQVLQVSWD